MVEVENYLLNHQNLKIIQRKDMFNFSLDTVLVANWASLTKEVKTIVDFGTNNGAIPLLLSTRYDRKIIGVEIQEAAYKLALKNIALNQLDNIEIVHDDIKHYCQKNRDQKVNMVICNPPFFKVGERSNLNENEALQIARHEVKINLEEIISCAASILDYHGKFTLIHRPDRLIEIIELMKKYKLEPKRLRMIHPKLNKPCHMILIEGKYQGNSGLIIEEPLYAHNDDGSYSDEVMEMFGGKNDSK